MAGARREAPYRVAADIGAAPALVDAVARLMPALTSEELAVLAAWFETVALPPPPFRSAPRAEIHEPEAWRRQVLWDIHCGPSGLYWQTALGEVRWLAKRIAPPAVQRAAHTDELAERPGQAF